MERLQNDLRIAEAALSNGNAKLFPENLREAIVLFEEALRIVEDAEAALGISTR